MYRTVIDPGSVGLVPISVLKVGSYYYPCSVLAFKVFSTLSLIGSTLKPKANRYLSKTNQIEYNMLKSDKINISKYLIRLEETKDPVNNIVILSLDLAKEIKNILREKETLMIKDNEFPLLEVSTSKKAGSTEILMWAIAMLSSAWTEWCFTAKTNDQKYQTDEIHPEASGNVKIARPYIRPSMIDAISKGEEIGTRDTSDPKTAYRPESGPAWIELRKE